MRTGKSLFYHRLQWEIRYQLPVLTGATLKYLQDGHKSQKYKMATFSARNVIIPASKLLRRHGCGQN